MSSFQLRFIWRTSGRNRRANIPCRITTYTYNVVIECTRIVRRVCVRSIGYRHRGVYIILLVIGRRRIPRRFFPVLQDPLSYLVCLAWRSSSAVRCIADRSTRLLTAAPVYTRRLARAYTLFGPCLGPCANTYVYTMDACVHVT